MDRIGLVSSATTTGNDLVSLSETLESGLFVSLLGVDGSDPVLS